MRNPFNISERRRLRGLRRLPRIWAIFCLIPEYIAWLAYRITPKPVRIALSLIYRGLLFPLRLARGWFGVWGSSRKWEKMAWGIPFVLAVVFALTVPFVYDNTATDEKFGKQIQRGVRAVSDGKWETADFVFTRLVDLPELYDDESVLYYSLLIAMRRGNTERIARLEQRMMSLPGQVSAKLLVAGQKIERAESVYDAGFQEGKQILEDLLSQGITLGERDQVCEQLGNVFAARGEHREAIRFYGQAEDMSINGGYRYAEALLLMGYRKKAAGTVAVIEKKLVGSLPGQHLLIKVALPMLRSEALSNSGIEASALQSAFEVFKRESPFATESDFQAASRTLIARIFRFQSVESGELGLLAVEEILKKARGGYLPPIVSGVVIGLSDPMSQRFVFLPSWDTLVRSGKALRVWHLTQGLKAWASSNENEAEVHFRIFVRMTPKAMDHLAGIAPVIATSSEQVVTEWARFAGLGGDFSFSEDRITNSLRFLDLVAKLSDSPPVSHAMARAGILATQGRWREVIEVCEPVGESEDETLQRSIQTLLLRAYLETGDQVKAAELRKQYQHKDVYVPAELPTLAE